MLNNSVTVHIGVSLIMRTYSFPLNLNGVRKTYSLCDVTGLTACPVTPGPVVFSLPIFIPKSGYRLTKQSEYWASITLSETRITQIMCVRFRYAILNWA
ncbi:hypothetical protein Bca4012_027893 [Brassica carinata]